MRGLDVYEKIDERVAVIKCINTSVNTKWIDTDKVFEMVSNHISSRLVVKEFKSGDRSDLYTRTPPLEAMNCIMTIATTHSVECSLMLSMLSVHISMSRLRDPY